MSASTSKLFEPIQVGDLKLNHRVVLAPLTRLRANDEHVSISELTSVYYSQRASVPGSLLISEATFIHRRAGGFTNVPALETEEQLAAWKKVTDAVHEKKSYIFSQLWALGRAAEPDVLESEGLPYVAASDIPFADQPKPRPLTSDEIKEFVQFYATAAANAVNKAGFDGVEIHGANGYLIDQFLQDVSNNRTDEYGGSIENRARFALEVVDAVVKAVGQKKVGIRLSPWGTFGDMRMKDPIPTFKYLVSHIKELYPDFAYIHVVEPRVNGNTDREPEKGESNDFLREVWKPRPFISAGGYNREIALEVADMTGDLIAFGRYYISNPDLPLRLKANIPLTPYDRSLFYKKKSPIGYIDYKFGVDVDKEVKKWGL
ncbi:unnamed protein product [Somion occarium]|uniref:NADH:flavin oxidoreductase/NADH oxidase N-terminal domain-containing protein n=1 Tax=Somion occarium TaxID=3059160 RepID=A0ABP1DTL9_9APHY